MTVLIYSMDGESSRLEVQELDPRWTPRPCLLPACGLGQHRHDPSQPVLGSSASQWTVTTVPPRGLLWRLQRSLGKALLTVPSVSARGKLAQRQCMGQAGHCCHESSTARFQVPGGHRRHSYFPMCTVSSIHTAHCRITFSSSKILHKQKNVKDLMIELNLQIKKSKFL